MSILNKLIGTEPRINAHGFQAAMSEWSDGATGFSRVTIITEFGLSTDEETELDTIKAIYDSANTNAKRQRLLKAFDSVVMLAGDRDVTWYKDNPSIMDRLNEAAS